jgi:hypothetical protein
VGSRLSSGSPLLTVTDVGGLTVTAEVDETDVLLVAAGQRAVVELDAVPGATYDATVTAVDLTPSASSGGRGRLPRPAGAGRRHHRGRRPGAQPPAGDERHRRPAGPLGAVRPGGAVGGRGPRRGRGRGLRRPGRPGAAGGVSLGAQGDDLVEVRRGLSAASRWWCATPTG